MKSPREIQASLTKDNGISTDKVTFLSDIPFRIGVYNMWSQLHVNIDFIQNKLIMDRKLSPAIICYSCKLMLDYVGEIIHSTVGGALPTETMPIRSVTASEMLEEVNTEYFNEEKRVLILNSLILMVTRSLAGGPAAGKDDIIRCLYTIKDNLLTK